MSWLLFSLVGNMPVARWLGLYAENDGQEEDNEEEEDGSTDSQSHNQFCKGESEHTVW